MRHAFLGMGGIGGLLGAALARTGAPCLMLLRPETLAGYDGRISVESAVLGNFDADVPATSMLDRAVDVLWIAVKATELDAALARAPADQVGRATVIPLLNGIDHVALLRAHYRSVVAGAIRVESERAAPGEIRQRSPFLRVELAGAEPVADELLQADIPCVVRDDELSLLWDKLAFLAPVALATTALAAPLGTARVDERFLRCRAETFAVARAEGAEIDEAAVVELHQTAPGEMQSSMQKDVAAGRQPELDAIAGPILRGGMRRGIAVSATKELASLVS